MKKRRSKSDSNKMAYRSQFSSVVPGRMQIYNIKLATYQVKLLTLAKKDDLTCFGGFDVESRFGKALQLLN